MNFENACNILNLYANNFYRKRITKKLSYVSSLKYHPDKNNNSIESKIIFQNITEAYNYLNQINKEIQKI